MRAPWEAEADYYERRRRDQGIAPYREMLKWKRRFWWLVAIDIAILGFFVGFLSRLK
jgi:hypothetical protein